MTISLSQSWDWRANMSEVALNKSANPNPATGTTAPLLVNGALYHGAPSDPNVYLYGGTSPHSNISFTGSNWPASQQYSLWSYDASDTRWNQYDISDGAYWRPSNGFYAEAPDQDLAFYFNSELDSGSSMNTIALGSYVKPSLEGMVVINTTAQTATNLSTGAVSGDLLRTRGGMVYIPGIREYGILLAVGGTYKPVDELDSVETANYVPMGTVDVFDIGASFRNDSSESGWFKQNTTGSVPQPRD